MREDRFYQAHEGPLGIVAGNGALPQMVLDGARDAGRNIVMAGLQKAYPLLMKKYSASKPHPEFV